MGYVTGYFSVAHRAGLILIGARFLANNFLENQMKSSIWAVAMLSAFATAPALAGDAPSIGGQASISVNIAGAIINAGGAVSGGTVNAKQAVGSVLHGSTSGKLKLDVDLKGAVTNLGGAASGGTMNACQSVGTIGSDC